MTWYGSKLDIKLKAPRLTPPYHTDAQIESLLKASKQKKTHKKLAVRDSLMIEFATTTGLRRSELANIKVGDIDFANRKLQVLGKGNKKRTIPLIHSVSAKLERYCKHKSPYDSLFGLKPACLSNHIRLIAKRAGIELHTHSLRHYFGTKLVEKGANLRAVQELMGHSSLNTTQVYVGVTSKHLEGAIRLLEK
jgi:site-specific recombinase XerD